MPDRPYEQPHSGFRSTLDKIDPLPGLYRRALKQADRRNLKSAGMVLVNSQFIRQSVAEIDQVDARVCYHGVDIDQFKPLSLKKQRMVLSVGSLTPLKGFDFLILALAEIPSDKRPRLVIASNFQNQPEKMYLSGLARDKGVKGQWEYAFMR